MAEVAAYLPPVKAKTGSGGRPWVVYDSPKPPRVADCYAYWGEEAPPEPSARARWWLRQMAALWRCEARGLRHLRRVVRRLHLGVHQPDLPRGRRRTLTLRVILEGGQSDTERLVLDDGQPPAHVERQGERYEPVLSHFDEHLRDITGAWRYRLRVEHLAMRPGHSTISVKP